MMEGIIELHEHGIFHGKVETTTLKIGNGLSKRARHRGKDEVVLLIELNLNKKHSNPALRNTLATIRVLVSMLM